MKKTLILIFLALFAVSCSKGVENYVQQLNANVQNNQKASDDFETYLKQGNDLLVDKEFEKAEVNFKKALEIADGKNWINEKVGTKERLATTFWGKKDFEKSKSMYYEAIEDCEKNAGCNSEQLDVVFGYLSIMTFKDLKEPSEIEQFMKKVKSSKVLAKDDLVDEKLCKYIERMRGFGLSDEAKKYSPQVNCGTQP